AAWLLGRLGRCADRCRGNPGGATSLYPLALADGDPAGHQRSILLHKQLLAVLGLAYCGSVDRQPQHPDPPALGGTPPERAARLKSRPAALKRSTRPSPRPTGVNP